MIDPKEKSCAHCFIWMSLVSLREHALVPEVANAGEEHCQAEAVGSSDDLRVALRAPGLNNRCGPGPGDLFYSIGKREKRIRSGDCSFERELRLHRADFRRVHTAHLP